MKYGLMLALTSLLAGPVFSQSPKSIRVKAGEDLAQAYSPHGFYRFPQFDKATLYFNTGSKNTGLRFNYSLLSGAVQFINPKGDTMDLVLSPGLDSVAFDKQVMIFTPTNGFLEVVAQSDSIKLLKKLVIKTQVESIGAYGQPSPTGAITNVKNISVRAGVFTLIVNEDVVLSEDIDWYFTNGAGAPVRANKSNLLKLLPAEKQSKVEAYLKKNKVSFRQEDDLKGLVAAISS